MSGMPKIGVILANTGTPDSPDADAVRDYLAAFLSDPRIRPAKSRLWDVFLKRFILPKRSPRSAQKYREIWTESGSPLLMNMQNLASLLEEAFASQGTNCTVRCGMSYGSPSITDALSDLHNAGCEEICVLPLYPQSAFSTTAVVADKMQEAFDSLDWHPSLVFVNEYCEYPSYARAIAASVKGAGFVPSRDDRLIFAFHSIPLSDIRNGDRYDKLSHDSARSIARELGLDDSQWDIGFQSRFDKSRAWLGPSLVQVVQKTLQDWHSEGGHLFVVTPNFAVDCLETQFDIDIELRNKVAAMCDEAFAAESFMYVPCLNTSQEHVKLLCEIAEENISFERTYT